MTIPYHRVGDHGQRYKIETLDYPKPGWQPAGYSATLTGANNMADAFKLAPSCTDARIIDRHCNHDNSTSLN